ncbi:MAG TPA: proline dehydrogenase, partial [Polyangiaceae bacterium]|nr:proline dehydrogenase [Polyangiaceae bacterium]
MTDSDEERLGRVRRAVKAAACIADPAHPLGIRARAELPSATSLSPENVELCLRECLETSPSEAELMQLLKSTPLAPAAHVLLSANVFVGAHRAIAVALAASARVC